MTIVALIPAHDEAERIAATVDSGTLDPGRRPCRRRRRRLQRRHRSCSPKRRVPRSSVLTTNVGKGAALDTGALRAEDADILLLLDADLGETASQGALLLAPVLAGEADMAIATFPRPTGKAGFGLVKGLARWGIRTHGRRVRSDRSPLGAASLDARGCRRHASVLDGLRCRGHDDHPGAASGSAPGRGADDDVARGDGAGRLGIRAPWTPVAARGDGARANGVREALNLRSHAVHRELARYRSTQLSTVMIERLVLPVVSSGKRGRRVRQQPLVEVDVHVLVAGRELVRVAAGVLLQRVAA